jgi:cobalt-zinc-cadmium efflux system outer membrane protein
VQITLQIVYGLVLVAAEAPADAACRRLVTPGSAVRCALARGPGVAVADADIAAARARRDAARVVLPANPQLDFLAAHRRGQTDRDFNVYGTLRQEVEIGGQRRARMRVADAEIEASQADAAATRRALAVDALVAWYDAVAARRHGRVAAQALEVARALETLARERAEAGASAGIELDLARAARIVAARRELAAKRDEQRARASLGALLGIAPTDLELGDELVPLPTDDAAGADRPELAAAGARTRAHERRTTVLRRDRVPDPVFVVTVQRDGFGELVAGGGLSFGLPLPSPFGRTAKGEIAESRALERRARAQHEVVRRRITHEVENARVELAARRSELALFDEAALAGARDALSALASAIVAGQIDLRGGLVAQQELLELLEGEVEAAHGLCLAAVAWAYAVGTDLEAVR